MTEPKRTIFEGLRNSFNFRNDVGKIIKFNSFFSKLGFERVNTDKEFGIHTYYPQLTLMIKPTLVLDEDDSSVKIEDINSFTAEYCNSRRNNVTFNLWCNFLSNKKGYLGLSNFNIIKRTTENIKPLKIEFEGKELIFGHYLKERNIVMLYINPFNTDLTAENNEYLDLILKTFEDKIKEIELVKIDVSEKMKIAFIEKFKKEINNKITEIKNGLKYGEDEINNLQISLLKSIRTSQLNRKQIEGLISFSTNTDDTIKKAIEEVKQLPFVKNVCITGSGIGLDVGKITIKHKEQEVYIGDFYLIISPDGVKVYCKNPILNNEKLEVSHPHIDGNHNCYGGEREQKILEYLSTFDLKKLVFFVYMFLKTYTPDDSYNNLSMWVREDLHRRRTEEIKTEADVLNAEFQGDYFQEKEDAGRYEDAFGDNDDNEEEDDDDYLGDCRHCGDCLYESGEFFRDEDSDFLFCNRSCRDEYILSENNP